MSKELELFRTGLFQSDGGIVKTYVYLNGSNHQAGKEA